MREFSGKTAVVTGAASGIGLGLAHALAREGMNVVLADVEEEPLARAKAEFAELNVRTLAAAVDVSEREAMYALAERVAAEMGPVHLLANNAGVAYLGTPLDEISDADYDWVIGVNLRGAINGIKAFVPAIKARGEGGHVVNTASIAGFHVMPGWHHGLYCLTKYAVVALSEALREDLEPFDIGVSVLCPAGVQTDIYQAGRNRPERYGGAFERDENHALAHLDESGLPPDEIAAKVLRAIRRNDLYIFTHPETRELVERRFDRVLAAYAAGDSG
jgi:NAD(P)-dependent dehydrogenase (short-subunit alcohol dehydrogenase family)